MKAIRSGCLNGASGAELTSGPSLNGDGAKKDTTEVIGEDIFNGVSYNAED